MDLGVSSLNLLFKLTYHSLKNLNATSLQQIFQNLQIILPTPQKLKLHNNQIVQQTIRHTLWCNPINICIASELNQRPSPIPDTPSKMRFQEYQRTMSIQKAHMSTYLTQPNSGKLAPHSNLMRAPCYVK